MRVVGLLMLGSKVLRIHFECLPNLISLVLIIIVCVHDSVDLLVSLPLFFIISDLIITDSCTANVTIIVRPLSGGKLALLHRSLATARVERA